MKHISKEDIGEHDLVVTITLEHKKMKTKSGNYVFRQHEQKVQEFEKKFNYLMFIVKRTLLKEGVLGE